jgi:hypothetical protein
LCLGEVVVIGLGWGEWGGGGALLYFECHMTPFLFTCDYSIFIAVSFDLPLCIFNIFKVFGYMRLCTVQ